MSQSKSNGDLDLASLSAEERTKILAVMKKAKEFEQQEGLELMRQPIEGSLSKYTNVMKGWQFRWFVLDPDMGRLNYYEKEEYKKQKPRGYVQLAGTMISPSEEDSQTFNVNASNGEIYRLRASDAKERQVWVNRLRATSEYHTDALLKNPQIGNSREGRAMGGGQSYGSVDSLNKSMENLRSNRKSSIGSAVAGSSNLSDTQFKEVKDMLVQVSHQMQTLSYRIAALPGNKQETPHTTQRDMLILKATSAATLSCLDSCLHILQQQHHVLHHSQSPRGAKNTLPFIHQHRRLGSYSNMSSSADSFTSVMTSPFSAPDSAHHSPRSCRLGGSGEMSARINHNDEVEDAETYHDTDLGNVEEHKNFILHLLSQLKLGMDLTKVVLPTFILEKRSLLEMFADTMAHPDMFVSIPDQPDPERRMIAVLEWYLTSFHAGRQGCLAKKPYNPIIGETFHCSWKIGDNSNNNATNNPSSVATSNNNNEQTTENPTTLTSSSNTNINTNQSNDINNSTRDNNSRSVLQPNVNNAGDQDSVNNSASLNATEVDNTSAPVANDDNISDVKGQNNNCFEWSRRPNTHSYRQHFPANKTQFYVEGDQLQQRGQYETNESAKGKLIYTAEQVSHHPPISAFYYECPDKRMFMNASIYTKSKFLGMSIGVSMIGKAHLHLLSHSEEYEFSLPSAYARSILTVPWVELGDKVNITCASTGYSAAVVFHIKPFYGGGHLHKVTAEVKNPNGDIVCKVNGEWNSELVFTHQTRYEETSKQIKVDTLPVRRKCVRPLHLQGEFESRKLWERVTQALLKEDIDSATEHKRFLEERQRQGEKVRKETNSAFPIKYFHKENDRYVYNKCLV